MIAQKGMNQAGVAKKMGISESRLSQILSTRVSVSDRRRITDAIKENKSGRR